MRNWHFPEDNRKDGSSICFVYNSERREGLLLFRLKLKNIKFSSQNS